MADITKVSPNMDTSTGMFAVHIAGLLAAEDLPICSMCYITSDGTVALADGSAADALAVFAGVNPREAKEGQPVALYSLGARFRYGAGMTPGAKLYISATAGALDDTATTGDAVGVARVLTATDIQITRAI